MAEGVSAIEMASYASYELNIRRRDYIKPEVHTSYMHLFSASVPINENLFGGESAKCLDDIEKANRAAAKARANHTSNFTTYHNNFGIHRRFGARGRGRGNRPRRGFFKPGRGRGHFLGPSNPRYSMFSQPTNQHQKKKSQ